MDIQVSHEHVKTDGADLDERVGHRGNRGNFESVLLEEERQRYPNAVFVIDEKNARTISDLVGGDGDLGPDAAGFAQRKLPVATKAGIGFLGTCPKGAHGQILEQRAAVQYRTCRRGCVVVDFLGSPILSGF